MLLPYHPEFNCFFTLDPYHYIAEICELIIGPAIWFPHGRVKDYPDIGDWSQKVWNELNSGTKRSALALTRIGNLEKIIGVLIYQRHKTNQFWLELKNLSVDPQFSRRGIASFLLKQAEIEGLREFPETTKIVCDTKAERTGVVNFLSTNRYKLIGVDNIYKFSSAGPDAIFEKNILCHSPKILRPV